MCLQNDETFRDLHAKHEESLNVAKDEQESLNREESLNIVKDEYSLGTVKDELDTSRTEFVACKVEDDAQNDDMIQGPEVKKSNETRKKYKPRNAHKTSESRKVQCQTCGAFVHPVHLPKHRLIHDKNRPMFACEQCPKKYTEQRKLKEHITIVHEGHLEHTCDRCGKTFHRWETLRQHYLGEHTDLKKYDWFYSKLSKVFKIILLSGMSARYVERSFPALRIVIIIIEWITQLRSHLLVPTVINPSNAG